MNTKEIIKSGFQPRKQNSHKNNYGKLVIIGGSKRYPGAPYITACGAMVSGVGYVALGVTDEVYPSVVNRIPEVIYECFESSFVNEKIYNNILNYSSIVFGNGIEETIESLHLLDKLLSDYKGILVIDATGLNILKSIGLDSLKQTKAKIVLTPHLGEFRRLFELDIEEKATNDYIDYLKDVTAKYNCVIDLKSAGSVIVGEGKTFDIPNPVPGLAKAGTGDFLAGLIGGLLAYSDLDITTTVAYGHALMIEAAERLSHTVSSHSFRATMLADSVSDVLKELEK